MEVGEFLIIAKTDRGECRVSYPQQTLFVLMDRFSAMRKSRIYQSVYSNL